MEGCEITVTLGKKITQILDKLVETELYGNSREEVAEELILKEMRVLLEDDIIDKLNTYFENNKD